VTVRRRARPRPLPDETKRETTRRHLLGTALSLFQERGVEATTMRSIARAAGLSLGAAYYHFPSKEALVFAYYEANQAEAEAAAERASGTLRERLGTIFHSKLAIIEPQRGMLAAIVPRLANPGDPLSAFSEKSREIRARAIRILERALEGTGLPPDAVALAAASLWLFELAAMLVFVSDDSPKQARTHGLVDDALDMIVPMLPLLATPMGKLISDRATAALARAGITIAA
jgi:AcrR family transcriptional regulator